MGTSLVGLLPQNTYVGLIKVGNNTALNATLKTLSDGAGNDLPMQASTTAINFTGTTTGLASGVSGAIQFSDGSAFASDATNFFWDNTNKRLGVRTNAPTATTHIVGANNLSSGYALKVLNASNGGMLSVTNDGYTQIGDFTSQGFGSILSFLRPAGGTRLTTFNQGNSNLTITNAIGNVTFQNTPVTIVGSGSTSATTSLLVQNSAGTQLLKVADDNGVVFGTVASATNRARFGTYLQLKYDTPAIDIWQGGSGVGLQITNAGALLAEFNDAAGGGAIIRHSLSVGSASFAVASAQLQVDSTTKGFLPPRMTTTQKNAIATPAAGLVVYDSTAKSPGYYDGTNWGYTGGALQNATGNGGTLNVSFAAGNIVNLTLNATTTLAFANSVIGTYIIQVTQSAGGGSSLVYPASVKWSGGTAPTLSTAVGKTDILTFYYDGTNYYGNYSLNY